MTGDEHVGRAEQVGQRAHALTGFQIEADDRHSGVEFVVPGFAQPFEGIAPWRLDLGCRRAVGHQAGDRHRPGDILRHADNFHSAVQWSRMTDRSMSGAIRQLCPCPSSTRMLARGVSEVISRA